MYHERRDRFQADHDALTWRWNRVANLRLAAFLVGAAVAVWAIREGSEAVTAVAAIPFVVFIGLIWLHRQLGRQRRWAATLRDLNDEAAKRVDRAWGEIPVRHTFRPDADHPFAADLDLFGRASLFHLLETVNTPYGQTTLRRWLLAPAGPADVRERQAAVAELAPLVDLREALAAHGRLLGEPKPDPEPFLQWAEGDRWCDQRRGLVWGARASVMLLWLGVAAQMFGVTGLPLWVPFLAFNLLVSQTVGREAQERIAAAGSQHGALLEYAALMERISGASFASARLRRLHEALTLDNEPAHVNLRRLRRLTSFWIPPSMLYVPIQMATLWDIHLLERLERWQLAAGQRVRLWLETVGEAESLAALAVLAHDNPSWAFPELDSTVDRFTATGLGHLLIAENRRVVNDVEVGPPGTFLLVTGSNMSGKSTLLRAIGVNVVLAGAGGPVCAAEMQLPPVSLWTSVRIEDSLERGVSYFMAELQRLKQIVDAARQAGPATARLLYLLDEILTGTNTAERQIAARRIIHFLAARNAIGAVSTHDLELADEPRLKTVARPIHFSEQFSDGPEGLQMWFDYTVRPGLATTSNALRLMEMVGFDLNEGGEARGREGESYATGVAPGSAPVEQASSSGSSGRR